MGDGASLEQGGVLSRLSAGKGAVPRKADARVRTRNGHEKAKWGNREGSEEGKERNRQGDGRRERTEKWRC